MKVIKEDINTILTEDLSIEDLNKFDDLCSDLDAAYSQFFDALVVLDNFGEDKNIRSLNLRSNIQDLKDWASYLYTDLESSREEIEDTINPNRNDDEEEE